MKSVHNHNCKTVYSNKKIILNTTAPTTTRQSCACSKKRKYSHHINRYCKKNFYNK